jgi:hypothetical protein
VTSDHDKQDDRCSKQINGLSLVRLFGMDFRSHIALGS